MPEGITSIGASAFANNDLTTITIPSTVTSIGDCAFLQMRLAPGSNKNLTKIINKTGRKFYWDPIVSGTEDEVENDWSIYFATGTFRGITQTITVTSS